MQVVVCGKCGVKNRVEESKLATSAANCGRFGATLTIRAQDSKPAVVTDQTFDREVLHAAGQPVLVDYWAPWCGACRMIAVVLEQLAAESQGRYRIENMNVDEIPPVASRYQIA